MDANTSKPLLLNLRAMFYLVLPSESSYEKLEQVPNFVDEAFPYFTCMVLLEAVVLRLQGKDWPRINDGINSMTHGVLSLLHSLLFRSIELLIYVWIYDNYHLIDLPWDSGVTWFVAFVLFDFFYYWFHRFSHESNIIWASHQVHHSSEDYNLTTALRQSLMQKYYSMCVYFPMALIVPPSAYYVHQQFNLLYQFWIHTEVVHSIGPLEYILNTASHHRVHHGRNPYCIDKNYGGTLIVWDRMFNTFQAEGEKVIYGLVHPNQFWDPLYGQFHHYLYILGLVRKYDSASDRVSAVVKGPGWEPGKPWRGLTEDLPEVEHPVRKYDKDIPTWASLYVVLHFALVLGGYSALAPHKEHLSAATSLGCVAFIIFSLTSFGALFDHKRWSCAAECLRCAIVVGLLLYVRGPIEFEPTLVSGTFVFFLLSAILWGVLTVLQYKFYVVTKKVD
ncbi:alkylglycerol monooxygenase [Aplysia californica]|uniref:Alkylglycerol monooxygenase n=1 Tax=Aplysia californica TaxID=6500 RepID=A0ABM0JXV2_APLCA|nr:alkylglycerol monooxygenase [Aplysia californica]